MSNYVIIDDNMVFHPGYYVEELLTKYSLEELSEKSGLPEKRLKDLINARVGLNMKDACGLSKALGTSVTLWINLQKAYDKEIANMEENNNLSKPNMEEER